MSDDNSLIDLRESLQRSFNELMLVLKALGTPNRLKILIILLEEPKTFQELIDSVNDSLERVSKLDKKTKD